MASLPFQAGCRRLTGVPSHIPFQGRHFRNSSRYMTHLTSPTLYIPSYSLLLVPDSEDDPICAFHKSFPDFLTHSGRCEDKRFFVDPPVCHTDILFSCLGLMKERLKKNICNLDGCPPSVMSRIYLTAGKLASGTLWNTHPGFGQSISRRFLATVLKLNGLGGN